MIDSLILVALGKGVDIIDKDNPVDIESIAQVLCKTTVSRDQQVSRISTVNKLAEYFENLQPDDKLFECKQQHEEALMKLNHLVHASNTNVCSNEKISMIEDYHALFVSTNLDDVGARAKDNRNEAPRLLRRFFMHYALEISAICKRSLINNLEWDLKQKFSDIDDLEPSGEHTTPFGYLFNGAIEKFAQFYSVNDFDDVVLFWDLIEDSLLNKKDENLQFDKINDEYDAKTGEPVRLRVKIRSNNHVKKIQQNCHNKYKPIYEKLILPIIRLANLGYSNNGEQFQVELEELRNNANVKHWYGITHLCEAILPMKFYQDTNLSPNALVIITKTEANQLDEQQNDDATGVDDYTYVMRLHYEPDTNSMERIDELELVKSVETQTLVDRVKSNLSARDRAIRRAKNVVLRNLRKQLRLSTANFFFSKPVAPSPTETTPGSSGAYVNEDIVDKYNKSLDLSDEELLSMNGGLAPKKVIANRHSMMERRKRRRRKGDVDMVKEMRANALSYRRTKTWSEIFDGWFSFAKVLQPSRTALLLFGGFILFVLFILLIAVAMASIPAAG